MRHLPTLFVALVFVAVLMQADNPYKHVDLPSLKTATAATNGEHGQSEERANQGTASGLTRGEWIMAVLTTIYVGITGFYAYVSHKTLRAIESQGEFARSQAKSNQEQFVLQLKAAQDAANGAQRSADAALLNARAVLNAERPWLIIVVDEHSTGNFTFKARNQGRTPAEVLFYSAEIEYIDDVANLGVPPTYSYKYPPGLTLVVPSMGASEGHEFSLLWHEVAAYFPQMEERRYLALQEGKEVVVFYFKVVYRNILSKSGITTPTYETCRCFWYSPKWKTSIRTDHVPAEYNRHT